MIDTKTAKMILQLNPWDDGDMLPLGQGVLAEYSAKKQSFTLRKNGEQIAVVSFSEVKRLAELK
jgi:hypothetical protein